jgi:sulfate/thiosulfate transport system ATP-binding protein
MSIKFEQVTKRYNGAPVVNDVSLRIDAGEFFVLLGPSGSGKSTLLRLAAGLTEVHHGRISLHGRDVTHVRARDRGVGLVFQHYALFRHMTVGENVEFALRIRGVRRRARAQRRDQLLQLVALEGYADRMPDQLSGGQQQRVAVARSLAHEPQVLLLDEPFGALDAKIRVELRETIREVQRRLGMTTILVTHDQEEAFSLADRIGIMHNGRLLETGRPESLYRHPATRFVATFLGAANLFLGERGPAGLRLGKRFLASGASLRAARGDQSADHEVVTVVRPEDIEVAEHDEQLHSSALGAGPVLSVDFIGASERLRVQLEPEWEVISAIGREHRASPSGAAPSSEQQIVDVTRTSTEQARIALKPGQPVTLGIRRFHLLPTPIASFRLLGTVPATAASLRSSPLLRQLVESMQAPVLDALDAMASSERDGTQAGVGVIAAGSQSIGEIARAAVQGRRWLLCIPPRATLPSRILIHCEHEAARSSTLRLVASVMRHLHAEATFVSLQSPAAPRAEATSAFRRLLDARAELQEIHGLDIRTDVHIGDPPSWAAQLASSAQPALVVLGIESAPGDLARILSEDFGALFTDASTSVVLLSYTEAQTPPVGARLDAISPLFPVSAPQSTNAASAASVATVAEVLPRTPA